MLRALAMGLFAVLAGCVFDRAGLLPPARDRSLTPLEARLADGSRDAPPDARTDAPPVDRGENDAALDQARADLWKVDQKTLDLPTPDLRKDLAKPDLPKPDLPKPDLPKPDLPKPDLPKPDLPKPDLPKPDLPKPDLPKSCASLFPGYQVCNDTTSSCRIYFSGSSKSCKTVCGTHACQKAEDNDTNNHCLPEPNMSCGGSPCTCDSVLGDGICTCSKL